MENGRSGPLRAVLYGRVSADRVGGRSVDSQLAEGRRWAARAGVHVVGEFRDDGISASRYANGKTRPGWQDTVNLIEAREVDILWLWELSRATRDRLVYAALLASCQEAGVRIVLDERTYDPNDPDDAYQLDTGAATAVLESGKISKRVRRAVEDRAAQGAPHGWVTYGYRSVYDPTTGKLVERVPDPDTAPIVREIARRLLDGESVYAVVKDLNARGIPAPRRGPWRGQNTRRLICNPAYAGLRVLRGQVQPGVKTKWPPLLTEDEHVQLKALFADPSRVKYRQDTRVRHLGTGIFRCGCDGCGGRMRVLTPKGRAPYYACRDCHGLSRLQEPVDELVNTLMARRLARPDVLELLAQRDDSPERQAAEEARRLRAQLDDVRRRVREGALTVEDLAYFRAAWEPKIRDAEQRARPKSVPPAVYDVAGPDAEAKWRALDIVRRRAIVAALVDVTILPAGRGHRWDPSLVRIEWKAGH